MAYELFFTTHYARLTNESIQTTTTTATVFRKIACEWAKEREREGHKNYGNKLGNIYVSLTEPNYTASLFSFTLAYRCCIEYT